VKNNDIGKDDLISSLISAGHRDVRPFNQLDLKLEINNSLKEGDVVVFLGAGDISSQAKNFTTTTLKDRMS